MSLAHDIPLRDELDHTLAKVQILKNTDLKAAILREAQRLAQRSIAWRYHAS